MSRIALFAVVCLSLTGCGQLLSQEKAQKEHLITPGVGIENLFLNESIQHAKANFSQDFVIKDGYLSLPSKGIEASYGTDEKIRTLFFYYKLPRYAVFPGRTDKGIGKESSIEDVYKAYGAPTSESDSVISEFGSVPGAKEYSIDYEQQGITFTFWDKKLADIRVFSPR